MFLDPGRVIRESRAFPSVFPFFSSVFSLPAPRILSVDSSLFNPRAQMPSRFPSVFLLPFPPQVPSPSLSFILFCNAAGLADYGLSWTLFYQSFRRPQRFPRRGAVFLTPMPDHPFSLLLFSSPGVLSSCSRSPSSFRDPIVFQNPCLLLALFVPVLPVLTGGRLSGPVEYPPVLSSNGFGTPISAPTCVFSHILGPVPATDPFCLSDVLALCGHTPPPILDLFLVILPGPRFCCP